MIQIRMQQGLSQEARIIRQIIGIILCLAGVFFLRP
jgi:hypothetical protein